MSLSNFSIRLILLTLLSITGLSHNVNSHIVDASLVNIDIDKNRVFIHQRLPGHTASFLAHDLGGRSNPNHDHKDKSNPHHSSHSYEGRDLAKVISKLWRVKGNNTACTQAEYKHHFEDDEFNILFEFECDNINEKLSIDLDWIKRAPDGHQVNVVLKLEGKQKLVIVTQDRTQLSLPMSKLLSGNVNEKNVD